jgi:HPt (histidine-containing phosphotransfer) domain-containing protein
MAEGIATQLAGELEAEDLRMVLDVFRDDAAQLSAAIAAAAGAADEVAFRRACHALAGAAGAVGAAALEQACRRGMNQGPQATTGLAILAAAIAGLAEAARAEALALPVG